MPKFTIQRAALNYLEALEGASGDLVRMVLHYELRSRSAMGADERDNAATIALGLRSILRSELREMLDIACGREPDAGQVRVLDVAEAWMSGRGGAA